MEVDVAA